MLWGQEEIPMVTATPSIVEEVAPQSNIVNSETNVLTVEEVKQLLEKLPQPTADAPATHDYTNLQAALEALNAEASWNAKVTQLEKNSGLSQNLDTDLTTANTESADLAKATLPTTSEEVENALKTLSPKLREVNDSVKELSGLLSSAPQRRLQQTQRLNELKQLINDPKNQATGTDPEAMAAEAKMQAWQAESDFLELSIAAADTRKVSLSKQLEIAKIRQAAMTDWNNRLTVQIKQLRSDDLKQQEEALRETSRNAAMKSPVLQKLAKSNQELLKRSKELNQYLERIGQRHKYFEYRAEWINKQLAEIKKRVEISGFSQAAATIMLKELGELPKLGKLEDEQDELEEEVRATQLELFDLPDELNESQSPEAQLSALGIELDEKEVKWLRTHEDLDVLQDLLKQSRENIAGLKSDANNYFEILLATDTEIIATMQATEQFRDYASENILWIPSRDIMSTRDVSSLPGLMGNVVHEFTAIIDTIIKGPVLRTLAFALVFGVFFMITRRWSQLTQQERQLPASLSKYGRTVKLLIFELYIASLPLAFLHLISWVLDDPKLNGNLSNAIAVTTTAVTPAIFFVVLLYRITRPNGLGQNHLRWPRTSCFQINKAIRWFLGPALCLGIFSVILDNYGDYINYFSGSRVFLLPSFILCLLALHVIFSPGKGILSRGYGMLSSSIGLRWVIYLLLMGWQSFLSVLVISGYMLGAVMLWGHTFRTFWLLAAVLIIKGLAELYLEIQQWNAHQQEKEELAAGQIAEMSEPNGFQLDESTRQVMSFLQWILILVGLSAIWADAFPSLQKLGSFSLLTFNGEPFISLGQTSMLIICLVTTVMLARSLPRLFEILILRRLGSIDPGSRHAFSTLVAYIVVIIGVIWASKILEIEWGNIQWLIAAISVGLGFGMQEIFGNLVAGIILLFERPIRVGDIVTVGETTGKVTRIQMRGTTIMEWDRRELIVPNKEFVTGQLTNWTLSDTLTRITLNVGVAYGSDISQVKQLILEVIEKDERVLEDPAPAVFFKEFGESSLLFLGFAYLGTLDGRLAVSSDLQQGIYESMNAAGIKIPLPQRDLHIVDGPAGLFPTEETTGLGEPPLNN
ncbi:mechanosensitive ion channel domain-containing protein [Cerasicoccus arenae]|uniref:Potassium transporter n=2 Tax=Cerasicoccus arenae TaxID=424488 RepID=A0A8J3DE70_9BACT|nr:mechanosensitive ion channel domain-containing protein [Cerasicoccus arenae]MBK1857905.1 mechanosensitive ion channel [Cerasicoccus arenae]GHC09565.1 potassium transporter [Cerasicoccus arenae]